MASIDNEPHSVKVSRTDDGITTITISRKHRRNAVDNPTARKLYDAFIQFEDDPTQKICVFYGDHGNFCAGFDLHEAAKASGASQVAPVQGRNQGPMGPSRLTISKPFISAVAGYAVAGGLELSLIGDMRVAEEDAVFGVFCRRWGVPLIDGGTVRLQAIVGLSRALDMILTGRPVDAKEAYTMGLCNRVVPKGKALEEATKLARSLLKFPQACMNLDRSSCYYAAYNASSLEDALRNEFEAGVNIVSTESKEGATRFSKGAGRHGGFNL